MSQYAPTVTIDIGLYGAAVPCNKERLKFSLWMMMMMKLWPY